LDEINSSELDFTISPIPANDYIDIEFDFTTQFCEVLFINDGGYIYFRQGISNISQNKKVTLDISNIPAGKYLVTIIDHKKYLNPKKIIVI